MLRYVVATHSTSVVPLVDMHVLHEREVHCYISILNTVHVMFVEITAPAVYMAQII